jgi:two-component system sensor kinase FixL
MTLEQPIVTIIPRRKLAKFASATGPLKPGVLRAVASVMLIATIFYFDTFTDLGSAFAVLYVMPLLIAGGNLRELNIIRWSLACAALTLLSFVIKHGADREIAAIMRMTISLSANVVTSLLIVRAKSMYATLHASECRYKSIFNSLAVAVWEHDLRPVQAAIDSVRATGVTDLRQYVREHPEFVSETRCRVPVIDVNDTAVRLLKFGTKDEFFSQLSEFLPVTDNSFAECIFAIDEKRSSFQAETRVVARDGEVIDVIVAMGFGSHSALDRVACSALDVTDAKRMGVIIDQTRAKLERAQRAGALGQLSAAIAHEVNQPLSAIRACASAARRWLRRDVPDIAEADAALEMVVEAIQQADDVIRGVRALTGKGAPDMQRVEVDDLIKDCATIMQREVDDHEARLVLDLGAPGSTFDVDRILIQQVLVNLIMNAVQAMDESHGPAKQVLVKSRLDGKSVLITVADHGPGWQPRYLEMAFEAFQTTKPEGMGLGLSICRAAVETHGGEIRLLNNEGSGARVQLRLPVSRVAESSELEALIQPFETQGPFRSH